MAKRALQLATLKPGFHFPLPELTARVNGPNDGPSTRLVETRACQHGPCWRVMETGHPSTRAVNSGSGNRASLYTEDESDDDDDDGATNHKNVWKCRKRNAQFSQTINLSDNQSSLF